MMLSDGIERFDAIETIQYYYKTLKTYGKDMAILMKEKNTYHSETNQKNQIKSSEGHIDIRDNCFDYIRILSAILIVVGHVTMHMDVESVPIVSFLGRKWPGLFALFTISGFLIPPSLERSKSNYQYLKKRFLRLYPGLYAAFFLSLFCVIGIGSYVGCRYPSGDIIKWMIAQLTILQFYVPDGIRSYGTGNPNGALWTISMEIQMYFFIMIIWKHVREMKTRNWVISISAAALFNVAFGFIFDAIPEILAKSINVTFLPYLYVFLIGMFAYSKYDKVVPWLKKHALQLAAVYILWTCLVAPNLRVSIGHYRNVITGVLIAFLTIAIGYRFGRKSFKYEISYGLYIYHMIVINALIAINAQFGNILDVIIVLAITFLLSMVSFIFVEKPAMRVAHKTKE